jgi:CoA:oxalate CoA-transferase
MARRKAAGVRCGRVMSLAEVVSDPQGLAQETALETQHPGRVRMIGFPGKLRGTPAQLRRPAPALGEHTEAVLCALGDAPGPIATLRVSAWTGRAHHATAARLASLRRSVASS